MTCPRCGLARWYVELNRAVVDEQLELITYGAGCSPLVEEVIYVPAVLILKVPVITLVTQADSPIKEVLHPSVI